MSKKKDQEQSVSAGTNGADLKRALSWVFKENIFQDVALHGNVTWNPTVLVKLALFWVWSAESSLVAAADSAIESVLRLFGESALKTYQGLTDALVRNTGQLLPILWRRLHCLMEQCDKEKWRVGLWLAIAMDGSRVSVPRTRQNEARFSKPTTGRKKKSRKKKRSRHAKRKRMAARKKKNYDPQPGAPQMWLTLFWHVGLSLPWAWKCGPSYSSERTHVLEMLAEQKFPENTLFCGDAGFVGYDFWREMQAQGHHFLIRVGGNVRLLKRLGYVRECAGTVYSWPDAASKKKQAPLALRLLHFKDGRGDVYLVTNVLDKKALTDAQASEIYRRRWGIELQFRTLKQTFGRSKLRSRTPDNAEIELHWSLVGLWIIQLLAHKERTALGEPNAKTSVAAAIRIIRKMLNKDTATRPSSESLSRQLAQATTDTYERSSKKQSRNYPRRKEEPATGPPQLLVATAQQKRKSHQILEFQNAA